jgi:hypothetical protein
MVGPIAKYFHLHSGFLFVKLAAKHYISTGLEMIFDGKFRTFNKNAQMRKVLNMISENFPNSDVILRSFRFIIMFEFLGKNLILKDFLNSQNIQRPRIIKRINGSPN